MSEQLEYEFEKQFCPLTKEKCSYRCAWFKDGECCMQYLPNLVEKLDGIETTLDEIDSNISNFG